MKEPGFTAEKAIQGFNAAVDGWTPPLGPSLTVTMMEGIGYAADSPAAADLDNLCWIRCWGELEGVIVAVELTGRHDRTHCEHEGLRGELGYRKFDPATEEGRLRWMQLRRPILAYFKCPVSRLMQKKRSKEDYRKLKQGKLPNEGVCDPG